VLLILREAEQRADKVAKASHAKRDRDMGGPDLVPPGRLTLSIPHHVAGWPTKSAWGDLRDGRGPQLEEQLTAVITGIVAAAEDYRHVVARWRRAAEEHRQAAALHAERERLRAVEAARATEIERQAPAWASAARIRAYVAAARAAGTAAAPTGPGGLEGEAWFAWATDYADRLNPLEP
jgi:hypothetical protein